LETKKSLRAGQIVFSEGDPGDAMYVVIQGLVQIYRDTTSGRVVLAKIGAGQFFGEMALMRDQPRSATAVALTETALAAYQPDELEKLLDTRPAVGARMIQELIKRLRDTTDSLMEERKKRTSSW
jgi:CRP/FNR family transcriptional regulator